MAEAAPLNPLPQEIPDKLYFRIGEVAKLTGIKQYVLRFWEGEFSGLGPKKSGTGHRLYRRKDVEMVLEIKHLLYEKRFTIEGARKWLESRAKAEVAARSSSKSSKAAKAAKVPVAVPAPAPAAAMQGSLFGMGFAGYDDVRRELVEILEMLK